MSLYAALASALATLAMMPRGPGVRALRLLGRCDSVRDPWWQRMSRWLRARSPREAERRRAAGLDMLASLVAELQVGLPPRVALVRAMSESSALYPQTFAAARFGGDVVDSMRADSVTTPVLRALAAAWQVGEDSGAGLSAAVATLVSSARESEDVRRQLHAQLAAPKATARMLTGLPLVGVLMGLMLGGNPLEWLLSTAPGRICLIAGVALTAAGALWTHRIAVAAQARA